MSATPTVAVTNWIAAQLAGLPALSGVGIFVGAATEETPRPRRGHHDPYLTLRHLGSQDLRYVGGRLAGTRVTVEVTAWDEDTATNRLAPIVAAVHGAIDRQAGSQDGLTILSCVRITPVERQVLDENSLFTQLGGEYRIRTSAP